MWTPTALASEFRRYRRTVWRVVEAQHRISTNRLTSDLGEQQRLEELADSAKPDLPKSAHGLHYLLASPFRYGHTVASRLVARGASLKEVADFLGHQCLDTTTIYAKLDLGALREVALPWPEVSP